MAIAGPRLDRPSAIGDEGRPRAASLTVAALVVVGLLALSAHLAEQLRLVPALGLGVGLTVAGIALLERTRYRHLVAGHLCFHIAGTTLLLLLVLFVLLPAGAVLGTFTISLFGIAMTWADVGRAEALGNGLRQAGTSYVAMLGALLGFIVLVALARWAWLLLAAAFAETAPGLSIVAFLGTVAAASVAVHVGVRSLPIVDLVHRSRRQAVHARLSRLRSWLVVTASVTGGGAIFAAVLAGQGGFETALGDLPAVRSALGVLSSPVALLPFVAVGSVVLAVGTLAGFVSWVSGRYDDGLWRRLAAATAGFVLGIILLVSAVAPGGVTVSGVDILTLGIAGPIEVIFVVAVVWFGLRLELVSPRVVGPGLAAGGLVLAAAALGLGGFHPALVFATAIAAVFVWDVATFGLGLTVELGHLPDTRRLELFHAGLSLAVAVGAALVLVGLHLLREAVGNDVGATPAMALAALGVAVLLVPLRG